ncbi:MAG: MFS transporter [Nitrospirae bacterium]|nr:MAG: MFS transporter [Nitrospirota bacterium]
MDVSSEMVYPLVPLFLSSSLGASKFVIGTIEGIAEAAASFLKLFSGLLADRFHRYKLLMGLGYGISTCSRPLLALATHWGIVLTARFIDRTGKGLRTAPRDALIVAATPQTQLGMVFGFHRSMDTAGAILGPALAFGLLAVWPADYRLVFWLSVVPATLAVGLILFGIRADQPSSPASRFTWSWSLRGLDARFVGFLLVIGVFSLGHASTAFLLLKAEHAGVSSAWISGLYLLLNITHFLLLMPSGMLSDRIGRERVIILGFSLFIAAYSGLAWFANPWSLGGFFVLYGMYMGMTEGVLRAYVATLVSERQRATGFGLYHMVAGIMIFPANVIAGMLWDHIGPAAPFWFGSGLAALAIGLFVGVVWRPPFQALYKH